MKKEKVEICGPEKVEEILRSVENEHMNKMIEEVNERLARELYDNPPDMGGS